MAKRFTENELQSIVSDYNAGNGLRLYELANKYNRSSSSIIKKFIDMGIYKAQNYRFTKDDIEFLRKHYPYSEWDVIMEHFHNVSKQSIITKASRLGIKKCTLCWTDYEIGLLYKLYPMGKIKELQKLLPNRSYGSITTKAKKMGLRNREFWTVSENKLLTDIYPNLPVNDVLSYFPKRSRSSIIAQAARLNLKSFDYNPWTEAEDKYIINHWKLQPDMIMAKKIERTQRATKARREYLGLYRRDMNSVKYESLSKYIRGKLQFWKTDSMKNCNYQCIFTGSKDFHIHHLYGVSNIISDIFKKYDIIEKPFDEYLLSELERILVLFINEQAKYPLGVCIEKRIHTLFHSMYGQYCNTPEQWYQFEKDYRSGVYDEFINSKKVS